jgi:multidrug efflux system outer membrane protein
MRAQQAQTAAETERARLTDLRYKNGASSYLEVLDAQRSLFASQQAVLQLQAQSQQNLATLYRVLGGGWAAESAKP